MQIATPNGALWLNAADIIVIQVEKHDITLTLRHGLQFRWAEETVEKARKAAESVVDLIDEETQKP